MKKLSIILLIMISIIIFIVYIIYNIYIRKEYKKINEDSINFKEKIISSDLRIGITDFDNINPILSENVKVQNISRLIFEPLINLSSDYRLEECLAIEWSKTDKNAYLIKLRENVKWNDGKKFDSNDVIFTIDMIKKLKNQSIYFYNVKDIKEVKKIDEYTIKIITNKEIPYFEYNLIFPIMSSKYYMENNFTKLNKNITPVGTGMYYIYDNNKNEISLKINTDYWNKKESQIDNISVKLYESINKAINDIENNKLDLITTSLIDIDNYIDKTKCNTKTFIGRNYNYIAINFKKNFLKNKKLRQVISCRINKDEIIKKVYNDKYVQSNFPLDFGSFLYNRNSSQTVYNKNKALRLLKENKIKNKKLKLLVEKNNKENIKVAEIIKEQLKELGIKIIVIKKDYKQYKKELENDNYDLAIIENTFSYSPDLSLYFSENNLSNYNNNTILKLLKNMENNTEEKNKENINKIVEFYNKDIPYISLYYDTNTIIYSKNLKGEITPNSYNIFYNIENWYMEYSK